MNAAGAAGATRRRRGWIDAHRVVLLTALFLVIEFIPWQRLWWHDDPRAQTVAALTVTIPVQDRDRVHDWKSFFALYPALAGGSDECRIVLATLRRRALIDPGLGFPGAGESYKVDVLFEDHPDPHAAPDTERRFVESVNKLTDHQCE